MTERDLSPREAELVRWAGASIQVLVHDVRNHLTRILGEAQMLAWKAGAAEGAPARLTDDVSARCDRIQQAVRECDAMMSRFQTIYREPTPDLRAVPLATLVGEAVMGLTDAQRARIETAVPPDLTVHADLAISTRAIRECVRNALAAGAPDGPVRIAGASREGAVALSVSDDGVGMAPEVLAKARLPFYCAREGARSTGIGLTVCERAMALVGGSLELSSEGPGAGTVARLVFAPATGAPPR